MYVLNLHHPIGLSWLRYPSSLLPSNFLDGISKAEPVGRGWRHSQSQAATRTRKLLLHGGPCLRAGGAEACADGLMA